MFLLVVQKKKNNNVRSGIIAVTSPYLELCAIFGLLVSYHRRIGLPFLHLQILRLISLIIEENLHISVRNASSLIEL